MSDLQNKVGIVTGGSSGIGFQIANVLAGDGATVYSISRTGAPKEGMGESVIHLKGDISDMAAMKALVDEIAAKNGGGLDFLVNNAGATFKCRAESFPMDQFDRIMDVNVKYVFGMSQLCYPYLKQSAGRGRIINITSMSAHLGFSEVIPYCASKGAVLSMTRGLAVEWAQDNICDNSIAPGGRPCQGTENPQPHAPSFLRRYQGPGRPCQLPLRLRRQLYNRPGFCG